MSGAPTASRARWGTPQAAVCGRAVTGADPDSGDNKEHHTEDRDHETEPHGVADVCVIVTQVVGIVINSHLPELPNSL